MEQRILSKLDLGGVASRQVFAAHTSSGDALPPAASLATQRSEVRAFETRITAKLDEMQMVSEQQRRREMQALEGRISNSFEQQVSLLMTRMDVCTQKIEACGQKVDACIQRVEGVGSEQASRISDLLPKLSEKLEEATRSSHAGLDTLKTHIDIGLGQLGMQAESILEKSEALTVLSRSGTDSLASKVEVAFAAQTKLLAASEDGWRTRLNELETNLICREDELESTLKRRHDDLLRQSPLRKVEELASEVGRIGERTEQAIDALGTTVSADIRAVGKSVSTKTEAAQGVITRQLAEV
eukprot:CAMPEP_0176088362 /NCGR_PEP_ID=MMETSP0120_2-20121206/44243_1 /TAXON_ID=160619 /ORGANISM="Kryptoperidinium foliaceum, Strain CCMP 1326" /LENGTH=298 /DNA_ID=CAMNT_0017422219 /DNA_START=18 /DNA_END=911 /DNA_ORIENTATION=-